MEADRLAVSPVAESKCSVRVALTVERKQRFRSRGAAVAADGIEGAGARNDKARKYPG